jgi:hypothetical protein
MIARIKESLFEKIIIQMGLEKYTGSWQKKAEDYKSLRTWMLKPDCLNLNSSLWHISYMIWGKVLNVCIHQIPRVYDRDNDITYGMCCWEHKLANISKTPATVLEML